MFIERRLSDYELHMLCGSIVHDMPFDQPLKPWQFVKPVPEKRFKVGVAPQAPIVKLGKKQHIDAFFRTGALQLGSYDYYNSFDHPEIGDSQEGVVTLLAKTPFGVIGGKYGSGYDQRMLCTFVGHVDRTTMMRFGYDSGFVILDPVNFSKSVADSIGATSSNFGQCLYRQQKAVLGFPGNEVDRHELSYKTGQIVNVGKHFIKPRCYSHQKEFRFLWEQSSDVVSAEIFDCSSSRRYCAPLAYRGR